MDCMSMHTYLNLIDGWYFIPSILDLLQMLQAASYTHASGQRGSLYLKTFHTNLRHRRF